MAKCPHCGKELEFTVIPKKPKAVKATPKASAAAKAKTVKKTAVTKTKNTAKPAAKKVFEPKKAPVPKRLLLKNPDFLTPGSVS
jgi:hypothetical protein